MNNNLNRFRKSKGIQGFSMVELMFAMGVLAVAILGAAVMIVIGIGRNGSNRMDTTATNVAQTVLEDIAGAPPNASPALTITDCQPANLQITTTPGGSALAANGDIDFSAAPVVGYQVNYTACGTNGLVAVYDVRWNIQQVPGGWGKLVTVAARQPLAVRNGTMVYIPPVTLRTVVGM